MTKALEYNGTFVLFKQPKHIQEAWLVVKNLNLPNVEEYAQVWLAKHKYKCEYTKQVEDVLKSFDLLVKTACYDKSC